MKATIQLPAVRTTTIAFVLLIILLPLAVLAVVQSQTNTELQSGFGPALASVHRAEAAGATTDELKQLVISLNAALQLNDNTANLTQPNQTTQRSQILTQLSQVLDGVSANATRLEAVASQRTFMGKVIAYVSAGIAAVVGTVVYAYGVSFWHKYRIKRTMQMRVVPKK